MSRRAMLGAAAMAGLGGRAEAMPTALPGSPSLLVAGPPGGHIDQWASLIADQLGRTLSKSETVARENIGGSDGVTGANHFQTTTMPDGATAMIAPGAAAMSWLVGDPRVRFDAGRWAPLWGGAVSALVVSRTPLVRGARVRVGVSSVGGPELAALLALELMGIETLAMPIEPSATAPLARADLDVLLLRGSTLKECEPEMAARHWAFAFGLGMIDATGRARRDPAFPDVPTAFELLEPSGAEQKRELVAALRSVAAAASLDVALVLPLLSPAAVVAWWRQGCVGLAAAPDVQEAAARGLVRPVEAGQVAASMASITAEPAALLVLRRWLVERYQWRPG